MGIVILWWDRATISFSSFRSRSHLSISSCDQFQQTLSSWTRKETFSCKNNGNNQILLKALPKNSAETSMVAAKKK